MKNISFLLTTQQIRDRTKTVTRRLNWHGLPVGTLLQGCVKTQGLKRGEKVQPLAVIEVVSVRWELLSRLESEHVYGDSEALKEGFPLLSGKQFLQLFMMHMKCHSGVSVNRIEFKYVD